MHRNLARVESLQIHSKTEQTRDKLARFFGQSVHVDVGLEVIVQRGLPAILTSTIHLAYFLASLIQDYSSELLFFYLDASRISSDLVWAKYLNVDAFFEINVDAKIKATIVHSASFEPALEHVYGLLVPLYKNFIKREVYQRMLTNHSRERTEDACQILREALAQFHDKRSEYYQLLKYAINEFTWTNLGRIL